MASLTSQVSTGGHDAAQASGTVDVSGGALNANGVNRYIGLNFGGLGAIKGNIITAASLDLYFTSASYDDPDVGISGRITEYTGSWSGTTNEISDFLGTPPVTVNWTATTLGTGWKTSPDLTTVLQSIADDGSWTSGYAILVVFGNSSSSFMRIRSYDGNASQAAKLTVYYESPSSGQPALARARLVPGMRRPHGSQGW